MNKEDSSPRFSFNLINNPGTLSILFVILIILAFTLILPVQPFVFDILICLSFVCAAAILFTVLYIKKPVMYLKLPIVILFYTILRLFINFSITKLIIMKGFDFQSKILKGLGGFIVSSPGTLVLTGGIVSLVVLIIIHYILIINGSSRVTEVTARIFNDTMPNKIIKIDYEFKNGIIDDNEYESKSKDIYKERDFYLQINNVGKFINADVITGLFLTIFNIVGGIVSGIIFRNESMFFSFSNYLALSFGAGLIYIIPSLLVATAISITAKKGANFI